jgi:hypothetical protein
MIVANLLALFVFAVGVADNNVSIMLALGCVGITFILFMERFSPFKVDEK